MLIKRVVCAFSASLLATIPLSAQERASTDQLDATAWNYVWDRLENLVGISHLPKTGPKEIVSVLKWPIPLMTDGIQSSTQLQEIAGVIPKPHFALDPSGQGERLHHVYPSIILDVQPPTTSPYQQKKLAEARSRYEKAYKEFDEARTLWRARIDNEIERLKNLGHKVTQQDIMRIRDATAGLVVSASEAVQEAASAYIALLPPDWALRDVHSHMLQLKHAVKDPTTGEIWTYIVSPPVDSVDVVCGDKGWTELNFDRSLTSNASRTGSWNASGMWAGSFFGLGGGTAKSYSTVIEGNTHKVSLRFCNLTFVSVSAPWLRMDILRDIDRGVYKLKENSAIGKKAILGPNGLIPRIVKGLIVARDIELTAILSRSTMEQIEQSYNAGGGLQIGPLSLGGGDRKKNYIVKSSANNGRFILSTNYGRPVALAVVSEETMRPE